MIEASGWLLFERPLKVLGAGMPVPSGQKDASVFDKANTEAMKPAISAPVEEISEGDEVPISYLHGDFQ